MTDATAPLGHYVTSTGIWKIRNDQTKDPGYLALHARAQFIEVAMAVLSRAISQQLFCVDIA